MTNEEKDLRENQYHKSLQLAVARCGIRGIDPKSNEGIYVDSLIAEFTKIAKPTLSAVVVDAVVEQVVSAILINRSAMTMLMSMGNPSKSATRSGNARRQAYAAALGAWKATSEKIVTYLKYLGAEGGQRQATRLRDLLDSIVEDESDPIEVDTLDIK